MWNTNATPWLELNTDFKGWITELAFIQEEKVSIPFCLLFFTGSPKGRGIPLKVNFDEPFFHKVVGMGLVNFVNKWGALDWHLEDRFIERITLPCICQIYLVFFCNWKRKVGIFPHSCHLTIFRCQCKSRTDVKVFALKRCFFIVSFKLLGLKWAYYLHPFRGRKAILGI